MLKKICYIVIFIIIMLPFMVSDSPKLSGVCNNVLLYVGSNSSNAKIVEKSAFVFDIKGESGTLKSDVKIEHVLQNFNCKLLFTESVCGITNYYYSANLPYKINLYGKTVNLHIAVGNQTVIGSPIIFGGY